jgi:prepilin-type N-terminal cleavage/methylation domain-containing protein
LRTRNASGFTIIELMIVAAIVAVIAAIAVPNWQRMNDNIRLKTAARAAMDTFRYAREQALRTGRRHLVFSQTGPAVDACGLAVPSPLLVLDDTDGDCCIDAAEPRWVPEEINQPAVQQTAFWGVTNATVRVPEDTGAGGITTGSSFRTPAGAATSGVAFRGDGVPVTMTAGCVAGAVGTGGGAFYFTNGRPGLSAASRRDFAVVLMPLGTTKVFQWEISTGTWTQ